MLWELSPEGRDTGEQIATPVDTGRGTAVQIGVGVGVLVSVKVTVPVGRIVWL